MDGSKSSSDVGCGIFHEDAVYVPKLVDYAPISPVELTAVATALIIVFNSSDSKFLIYSNLRSTLEAIKKFNNSYPLVQNLQE